MWPLKLQSELAGYVVNGGVCKHERDDERIYPVQQNRPFRGTVPAMVWKGVQDIPFHFLFPALTTRFLAL